MCRAYRAQTKGRVERLIRFVRERFFAARHFRDLDGLNAQAIDWCETVAAARPCPEDRLHQAAPASAALFRAAAERGLHVGVLTRGLLPLLDTYGAAALAQDTPSLGAVRQLIDQQRHAKGLPPRLPVPLPDDPRIKNLQVRPHDLDDYDQLHREDGDEHNDDT